MNTIKALRESKGITQEQVAQYSNITQRQYRRIEKGEHEPKATTAILIAKVLDSTVEEIFPYSKNN